MKAIALPISSLDIAAAVALALVVQTLISLLGACTPVLAARLATDKNWDVALLAFYGPLVCVAGFVINFEVPNLLRRLGGMGLSLACVAISTAGVLCLLASSVGWTILTPLAIGLATGAMNPASSQVLGPRTTTRTAGLIMSIKQVGVPLGGVLAGALLPALVMRVGTGGAIEILAIIAITMMAALLPTVRWLNGPARRAAGRYRPFAHVQRLLALPGMGRLVLAGTTFTAMQISLRSFFTVYLVEDMHVQFATAGLLFGASQLAGIAGQIGWAWLSDRYMTAQAVMTIVGVLMSAAAALTAMFTPGWPLIAMVLVAVLFGLSAAGFIPVVLGEVARRSTPEETGALTSAATLFQITGVFVGPLLFGAATAAFRQSLGFVALAACTLIGSAVLAAPYLSRTASVMPLRKRAKRR